MKSILPSSFASAPNTAEVVIRGSETFFNIWKEKMFFKNQYVKIKSSSRVVLSCFT